MNLAVIRERAPFDRRVALTPPVVRRLCGAGAQIAYSPEEAIGRAELLAKIGRPSDAELQWCAPNMAVLAFYHTAVAGRGLLDTLAERCLTAIDQCGELARGVYTLRGRRV